MLTFSVTPVSNDIEMEDEDVRQSGKILKEGNLIKKGHKRHNWKTRWFVLCEDGLYYYKSKKDTTLKGEINLRGCSIISPCSEYTKKDCVFRLIEHNGRESLIQTGDKQTQDEWTKAIAEIIRNLEMIPESDKATVEKREINEDFAEENSNTPSIFDTKVTYMELLDAMQDSEAGVSLQTFEIDQCTYKHCFTGKDIINWLLHWNFVKTRSDGVIAGGELLEKAHLHPVGPLSKNSVKRKDARRKFCDDVHALYRFSALTKNEDNLDWIFEDDSSDSEDETASAPLLDNDIGKIVKAGFLLKKGHVRHNWKIRKFILSDNPLCLLYYKPSKLKTPQGRISLTGVKIADMPPEKLEKDMQCIQGSCMKAASLKGYRHQFEMETKKGILYQLKADSEEEKRSWIEAIRISCLRESGRCFSI